MACEICGVDVNEVGCWVQCPIHFETICHRHCYSCVYHGEAGSMTWCSFWQRTFVLEKVEDEKSGENA